jgi:chaperonin GroES
VCFAANSRWSFSPNQKTGKIGAPIANAQSFFRFCGNFDSQIPVSPYLRKSVSMSTAMKSKKKSNVNLQPLGDRLVAQRDESEQKTTGGIYLPDTARDKPSRGVVISVGEGRIAKDGTRVSLQVKPGDRILFTSYGPEEFKVGEEEYLLLSENDVLAVLE